MRRRIVALAAAGIVAVGVGAAGVGVAFAETDSTTTSGADAPSNVVVVEKPVVDGRVSPTVGGDRYRVDVTGVSPVTDVNVITSNGPRDPGAVYPVHLRDGRGVVEVPADGVVSVMVQAADANKDVPYVSLTLPGQGAGNTGVYSAR